VPGGNQRPPPPQPNPALPPSRVSSEAASILERSIAAIEAMITSRRIVAAPAAEEPKSAADMLKAQLLGAQPAQPSAQVGVLLLFEGS
jgi:hypothetical protein